MRAYYEAGSYLEADKMPVAGAGVAMLPDGNLRSVALGIEPEFVDPIIDALLVLVDRLRQYQRVAAAKAHRPAAAVVRIDAPR